MNFYTAQDHFVLVPALMLAMFGCAIFLFDFWVFPSPKQRKWLLALRGARAGLRSFGLFRQQIALRELASSQAFRDR